MSWTSHGVISIFSDRFAAGEPVTVYGDGRQTRDFIAVEDLARANALAATQPDLEPTICNVCTGRPRTLLSILDIFRSVYPDAPPHRIAPARDGEIRHSCGSPDRAAKAIGFQATASLEASLRALIEQTRPLPALAVA